MYARVLRLSRLTTEREEKRGRETDQGASLSFVFPSLKRKMAILPMTMKFDRN